ncbi:MAG: quercetin dioxygenase-like cupin family protein [Clostridium sp.]|jgi:quercetin dioxygenase-like cupin family protein
MVTELFSRFNYNTGRDILKGEIKMIEKNYKFNKSSKKNVAKVIDDDNLLLMHMTLTKGTGLAEHFSNSNVYMVITKGILTIKLGQQVEKEYQQGNIVNIPYNIKMNINNFNEEILEFFVIKAPNPKNYVGD